MAPWLMSGHNPNIYLANLVELITGPPLKVKWFQNVETQVGVLFIILSCTIG